MKNKKKPRNCSVIWAARKIGNYPNGHVKCDGKFHVIVAIEPGDGFSYATRYSRKLARLIAKRINQCLDET